MHGWTQILNITQDPIMNSLSTPTISLTNALTCEEHQENCGSTTRGNIHRVLDYITWRLLSILEHILTLIRHFSDTCSYHVFSSTKYFFLKLRHLSNVFRTHLHFSYILLFTLEFWVLCLVSQYQRLFTKMKDPW